MHLLLNHSQKLIILTPTFIRFLKINFQWDNGNQRLPKTIAHSSKLPVTIFTILEHHIALVGEFYVAAIKILNQIQQIFASYYDYQHWREKTM